VTPSEVRAVEALGQLYARLEEAFAGRSCRACGACCHFKTFGHRLYATRLEALYLLTAAPRPERRFDHDSCGYQQGALCLARESRALGCRMFFCKAAGGESREGFEAALGEIRRITEEFGLAWDYRPLGEHINELVFGDFTEVQ
jgi:Fe-S-cluster containining protein